MAETTTTTPLTTTTAMTTTMDKKASSMLSKKRFFEIEKAFMWRTKNAALVEELMADIMEVMHFDPAQKQYSPERAAKNRDKLREEAAAKGQSIRSLEHDRTTRKNALKQAKV